MLKIITEDLMFYEFGQPFTCRFYLDEDTPMVDTKSTVVLNVLYLIYNISNGFKDIIVKALNDNNSQHGFKKLKRIYGKGNAVIKEYCYKLLKMQIKYMSRKKKNANVNLPIISDSFGASIHDGNSSVYGGSVYDCSSIADTNKTM